MVLKCVPNRRRKQYPDWLDVRRLNPPVTGEARILRELNAGPTFHGKSLGRGISSRRGEAWPIPVGAFETDGLESGQASWSAGGIAIAKQRGPYIFLIPLVYRSQGVVTGHGEPVDSGILGPMLCGKPGEVWLEGQGDLDEPECRQTTSGFSDQSLTVDPKELEGCQGCHHSATQHDRTGLVGILGSQEVNAQG